MTARASLPALAYASMSRSMRRAWAQSSLSWSDWLSLAGPLPDRITFYPAELRPGHRDVAIALRNGVYALPGGQVHVEGGAAPWVVKAPNERWAEVLNGFDWIRHFAAVNAPEAGQHVRWLITTWLSENGQWHELAWRPHVIARRLTSWFAHGRMIIDGSDLIWRSTFMRSMARQARHLHRTADWGSDGASRLMAAVGLALSGLSLPNGDRRLARGLAFVSRELDRQVLADGGHISRNPEVLLNLVLDLVMLRSSLLECDKDLPGNLQPSLDRMMPMLRFFRHGDGGLALFNGATEGADGALEIALSHDDVKGRPLRSATLSGYERMFGGRTVVIVDAGRAPPATFANEAHAGPLSFELSSGRHRVIVNCGATTLRGHDWQLPLRSTAAHSTLTLADTSTSQFVTGRAATRLLGPRMTGGPTRVRVERQDDSEQGTWLEMTHDAYEARFGLLHERRLYLNSRGTDLRGEDTLAYSGGGRSRFARAKPKAFELRFHLHPDVRAAAARDSASIMLALPNGEGWNFRAQGAKARLEESIYLGFGEQPRPTEQIVLTGRTGQRPVVVKWALRRIPKTPGQKG